MASNNNNGTVNGAVDSLVVSQQHQPPPSTAATAIAGAQSTAPLPKRPVRRGKAQPDRPVRALFCLGLKNPIRKICIYITELKYPFQIAIYFITIHNSLIKFNEQQSKTEMIFLNSL